MQGRVDGLLVMSPHVDAGFLRDNLPVDLPIVLMNTPLSDSRYSTMNVDNYGGAYAIVHHLIGCGHRRIAMIAGPERNFDAAERLRGYRAAMAKFAPMIPAEIIEGDFTEESGYRAGQQLLALKLRPQAVFAANDIMAAGCLYALKQADVAVPRDIALAGFDDIPIARFVSPPLTTVRVRIADLGRAAMERLAAGLEGTEAQPAIAETQACEIVVRESCGTTTESNART
jgi:LacI family transcriptional regulator